MAEHVPANPAHDQFEDFREYVLSSRTLQERLDAEEDVRKFVPLVVRLGAEHGYVFADADVAQALSENRRTWMERWIV